MTGGLGEALGVRPDERGRTLVAGAFFFFILFGYFMLRPARESLGTQSEIEVVRYLYLGTLAMTALANPLFSWLVARWPRRVCVPLTYRFFMLNIVVFFVLFLVLRSAEGEPTAAHVWVSRVYYVWLTVFALFNTMVFWAVMCDTFTLGQSKRLYPIIAIGGTLGALAGSMCAWSVAELIGTSWLVLSSVVVFECGVRCYRRFGRSGAGGVLPGRLCRECGYDLAGITAPVCPGCGAAPAERRDEALGGGVFDGFVRTVRSPYLLGISGYIMALTIVSTFLYFAELRIVRSMSGDVDERTALFANVNIWTQAATLFVQLFITGRLLRTIGTGRTLMLLPALSIAGFVALALAPSYALIVLAQAGYRAGKYAIARPARETLFTVVAPEDRYKSKAFVDTFVYRTGDVVGAMGDTVAERLAGPGEGAGEGAAGKLGGTLEAAAAIVVPLCVVWAGIGWYLGLYQSRLHEGLGVGPPRGGGRGGEVGSEASVAEE